MLSNKQVLTEEDRQPEYTLVNNRSGTTSKPLYRQGTRVGARKSVFGRGYPGSATEASRSPCDRRIGVPGWAPGDAKHPSGWCCALAIR